MKKVTSHFSEKVCAAKIAKVRSANEPTQVSAGRCTLRGSHHVKLTSLRIVGMGSIFMENGMVPKNGTRTRCDMA